MALYTEKIVYPKNLNTGNIGEFLKGILDDDDDIKNRINTLEAKLVNKSEEELCWCTFCKGYAVPTDSFPYNCCIRDVSESESESEVDPDDLLSRDKLEELKLSELGYSGLQPSDLYEPAPLVPLLRKPPQYERRRIN